MFDFFKKLFSNQIEENQVSPEGTTVVLENPGGADTVVENQVAKPDDKTKAGRRRGLPPVPRESN